MLLAASVILSGRSPLAADMIGVSVRHLGNSRRFGSLDTLNVATGGRQFNSLLQGNISGLSINPSNGVLYALDSNSNSLLTIDPTRWLFNGVTAVGDTNVNLTNSGLAFDHAGNLFAVNTNGGDSTLYSIDTGSGNATLLGNTGINGIDSIAFYQSQLYGISGTSQSLYAINESNGQANLAMSLGNILASNTRTGLGTDSLGNLYGIAGDSGDIFQIEPLKNLATLTANTLSGYESLAFTPSITPAAVPEPSSLALLAIGLVALVGSGWHKKRRTDAAT